MNKRMAVACVGASVGLSGCVIERAIPKWVPIEAARAAPLAQPSPRPFEVSAADALVDVSINGQPVRLRIESGHSGIVLNPAAAARIQLQPSLLSGYARVGTIKVKAETATAQVVVDGAQSGQRVIWYDRPVAAGADGIISMADLPYASVTVRFRPDAPGDRPMTLPTEPRDYSIVHQVLVGERNIDVRFLLANQDTLVTTAAGSHLAEQLDGRWAGPPQDQLIAFEIKRPARPMVFGRPLAIGDFRVSHALVRLRDYEGKKLLPTDPLPETNDIVVSGERKRMDAEFFVTVGRDVLGRCASMTYVAATRDLVLVCPAEQPV